MNATGTLGRTCPTCRGWSCLQCAESVAHDACRRDCPNCYDYRAVPEEPWLPTGVQGYPHRTAKARARRSAYRLGMQALAQDYARTRARRARLHRHLVAV